MEICLHNYTYTDQQPYRVFFVLNNGGLLSGGFSEVDAPGFVKEHFAKQKSE
jgi:hypothetical protein